MRRRAFLASALTVPSTIIAGCGSADSRIEHTNPTVENDEKDTAKYLKFHRDDAELATVGVDLNLNPMPRTLLVSISHSDDSQLQSLTQRFVTPNSDETPPQLSVSDSAEENDPPHPSVSLFQDGRATIADVDRFGELADETVFIPLTVTRWHESARRLVVESTVELVEEGVTDHTHVLEGQLEFEFSVEIQTKSRSATTLNSSGKTPNNGPGEEPGLLVRQPSPADGD